MGIGMRSVAGLAGVLCALTLGFTGTAAAAAPEGKVWVDSYNSGHAKGYVQDTKADGYCVQAKLTWFGPNGKLDTDWSDQACPNPERENFEKAPGDGPHFKAHRLIVEKCFLKDGKLSTCKEVLDEPVG